MSAGDVAFAAMAVNPVGGLLIAIPFAVLELHYPPWLAVLVGVPLSYVQVLAIDLAWSGLVRLRWWAGFLAARRSPRVERLLAARGGFWLTFVASPLIGPWLVMAFMRYAQVPQRRVALPIALALACTGAAVSVACVLVPTAFARN